MGTSSTGRIIAVALAVVLAIWLFTYVLRHLVALAFSVAIVSAILWMIVNAVGKKRSY